MGASLDFVVLLLEGFSFLFSCILSISPIPSLPMSACRSCFVPAMQGSSLHWRRVLKGGFAACFLGVHAVKLKLPFLCLVCSA